MLNIETLVAARTTSYENWYRPLRIVERPTQAQVLACHGWGRTELAPNEVLIAVHYGEDGPGFDTVRLREYTLVEQERACIADLQPWAQDEMYDAYGDAMELTYDEEA